MYKNLRFKNNQSEITPPLNKGGFEVEERGFLFSNPMYKNIYRELRPSSMKFDILVNKCWPFGQHFNCLVDLECEKNFMGHVWKSALSYI